MSVHGFSRCIGFDFVSVVRCFCFSVCVGSFCLFSTTQCGFGKWTISMSCMLVISPSASMSGADCCGVLTTDLMACTLRATRSARIPPVVVNFLHVQQQGLFVFFGRCSGETAVGSRCREMVTSSNFFFSWYLATGVEEPKKQYLAAAAVQNETRVFRVSR